MEERKGSKSAGGLWKLLLLCACAVAMCLVLSACGGGEANSVESSSSQPVNPAEKFIGDWQVAAAQSQGITMVGDFSQLIGGSSNMQITINADNTGSMSYNDESFNLTWEQNGDNAIKITPETTTQEIQQVDLTYNAEYEALEMNLEDAGTAGTILFSRSGAIEGLKAISTANATDITSEADLVGTWKLSSVNMMGVSMYGDADTLAEAMAPSSESIDTTLAIEEGGTASLMGTSATWEAGSDGAAISISGVAIPVQKLDDRLVMDMGGLFGLYGVDIVMVFSK